jgi:hypothetical protein
MKVYSINSPIRYKGKTLKSGVVEIPDDIAKDLVKSGVVTEQVSPVSDKPTSTPKTAVKKSVVKVTK